MGDGEVMGGVGQEGMGRPISGSENCYPFRLSIYPHSWGPFCLSVFLFVYISMFVYLNIDLLLSVCLFFICLTDCLSICLSISLVCLSFCPSVCLSDCLSLFLSIYPSGRSETVPEWPLLYRQELHLDLSWRSHVSRDQNVLGHRSRYTRAWMGTLFRMVPKLELAQLESS